MPISLETSRDRPLVLVAGGGVAALEACLALRHHASERDVDIELMAPEERFDYRPLAVLEPFQPGRGWSMTLAAFCADNDVRFVQDGLAAVEADDRVVRTTAGRRRPYDLLLVAVGAQAEASIPGALTFRGAEDAQPLRDMLDRLTPHARVAFVVPITPSWSLPLYELAMLSAARLRRIGEAQVVLVTPEPAPLALFGKRASGAVARMLDRHRIRLITGTSATRYEAGELHLERGRPIACDAVATLPRLAGRLIEGLPRDGDGFIPVDEHGRVEGRERIYAAGDGTSFPVKQGGLATQQADAAAEAMLAEIGFPIEPAPFRPRLRGVLYTEQEPAYLLEGPATGASGTAEPRPYSLWWPPSKIAGRHLSPYLVTEAGAPRAPEVRPASDLATALEIDEGFVVPQHRSG